jgi:putative ABC transport system substrate-binding protein
MQFQLIREAMPEARTVGILYRSDTEFGKNFLTRVKANLPEHWTLEAIAVDKHPSLSDAVDNLFSRSINVVWTYPEASIFNQTSVQDMLLSSRRTKIPIFGYSLGFVKAGALLGITINPKLQGERTAEVVTTLIKTGSCSFTDNDVIQTCEIAVNEFTAKQLKCTIPETIRKRAVHTFPSQ